MVGCSNAAASWSVNPSFAASSVGRSNGVSVAKFQTPCRSGSPQGVRGGAHGVAVLVADDVVAGAVLLVWLTRETGASDTTAIAAARTLSVHGRCITWIPS